jgi:hypothetical protein
MEKNNKKKYENIEEGEIYIEKNTCNKKGKIYYKYIFQINVFKYKLLNQIINQSQGQDQGQDLLKEKMIKNILDLINQGLELGQLKEKKLKEIAEKNIIKNLILILVHHPQKDIIEKRIKKKGKKKIEAEVIL